MLKNVWEMEGGRHNLNQSPPSQAILFFLSQKGHPLFWAPLPPLNCIVNIRARWKTQIYTQHRHPTIQAPFARASPPLQKCFFQKKRRVIFEPKPESIKEPWEGVVKRTRRTTQKMWRGEHYLNDVGVLGLGEEWVELWWWLNYAVWWGNSVVSEWRISG